MRGERTIPYFMGRTRWALLASKNFWKPLFVRGNLSTVLHWGKFLYQSSLCNIQRKMAVEWNTFCPLWYETKLEYLWSQHRSLNPNFKITRTVNFPILISIHPIIKMRCLKSQNKRGVFGNPYVDLKKHLLPLNLQIHNFCKFEESRFGEEWC